MTDELQAALEGKEPDKLPDIIYDRSKLEMIATCPHQAILEEKNPTETQDPLPVAGTIIHELIEETFEFCQGSNESTDMADYFANELAKVRPDLQPDVIQGAKGLIVDLLYLTPSSILAYEKQIDYVLLPATPKRGRIVITQCLDLLMTGFGDELEIWDWKTGWKERDKVTAWNELQAQCAALLIWKNYDGDHYGDDGVQLPKIDEVKFVFKETRRGKSVVVDFIRDKAPYRLQDLTQEAQFEGRISEAVRLHQAGCDEAWPSEKKCLWCNHVKECKLANLEAKELVDDPYGYVNQCCVIETLGKQMRKTIADYAKAHGAIVDPDGLTAQKKQPKNTWTLEIVPTVKSGRKTKKTTKKAVVDHDITNFK